jgi:Na+-translocating ferredoxin:NAD+ oxidoreductase subunit B
MADDIYVKLRDKIDEYSLGMATTETGVELQILKKLFTVEEAEMYLRLTGDLQTAAEIAQKINANPVDVERILQGMTNKGLTFPRFPKKDGEFFYYAAAPFVHGIVEHQLHRLDKEMAELLEEFFKMGPVTRFIPALRTIPVNSALRENLVVAPFDDAKAVIMRKERIAIAECLCNQWQTTRGGTCSQPKEICFLFDFYGQYYVDRGLGRWISQDEALAKLMIAEKAGLISQFSHSENPEALCNCCPDCCATLRGLKQLPTPAMFIPSNYLAAIDRDMCSLCTMCADRCPMDAVIINEGAVEISLDRCVGCGVCVSTCPENAIRLEQKPQEFRFIPPERGVFMRPSRELEGSIKSP